MRKSRLPLLAAGVVALAFAASALGSPAKPQLKVALVAPSAHNDLAFTQSMYAALQSLKASYNLKISVSENQFVVADAANITRQYAQQGYELVIAHGSQYGGTIQQIAPEFPKTTFAWGTAGSTFGQPNVYAYPAARTGRIRQGRDRRAPHQDEKLGVIGPVEAGDAKIYVDGFVAGAKLPSRRRRCRSPGRARSATRA